jgi:hypothetical protein
MICQSIHTLSPIKLFRFWSTQVVSLIFVTALGEKGVLAVNAVEAVSAAYRNARLRASCVSTYLAPRSNLLFSLRMESLPAALLLNHINVRERHLPQWISAWYCTTFVSIQDKSAPCEVPNREYQSISAM